MIAFIVYLAWKWEQNHPNVGVSPAVAYHTMSNDYETLLSHAIVHMRQAASYSHL